MRAILQRVSKASVKIKEAVQGSIEKGILVLLGVEDQDLEEDINWLVRKICHLRIFDDSSGVMNLSVKEIKGEILVVSQFTLHASTKKGHRPSYSKAAHSNTAMPLYKTFLEKLASEFGQPIQSGTFGAHMQTQLTGDGPVTILLDSKNKE